MKIQILLAALFLSFSAYSQKGDLGIDANGNTTVRCGSESWNTFDCSLANIPVGNVLPDKKEKDCQGVVKTLYGVLNEGKPLLIITEEWGCPGCWSSAGDKADYIQAHKTQINFWIAMGEYNGALAVSSTSNKYDQQSILGWQNSFPGLKGAYMFLDNDMTYTLNDIPSHPGIGLIDPRTKKVVYAGNDFAKAQMMAEKMANDILTGTQTASKNTSYSFYPNPVKDKLYITSSNQENIVQIISLDGRVVLESVINSFNGIVDIKGLNKGMYILKVNNKAENIYIE